MQRRTDMQTNNQSSCLQRGGYCNAVTQATRAICHIDAAEALNVQRQSSPSQKAITYEATKYLPHFRDIKMYATTLSAPGTMS
jgi:hypothetical protein